MHNTHVMSCLMRSKTRVVTLWTYDSHVSRENKKYTIHTQVNRRGELKIRYSHRIASAADKKTGALGYETKATYLMIILNILPIDLLGNLCRHRSLNRFWALHLNH